MSDVSPSQSGSDREPYLELDESSNGESVELRPGQLAELTLPENPTTGFRWQMEAAGEPDCSLVEDLFEPSPGPPGAAGVHRWRFQAVRAGIGRIELASRRPWQSSGPGAQRFSLEIRVSD